MPETLRFSAMAVEEFESPRPHYQVKVRGTVTAVSGLPDATVGLLPEEIVITLRLSTDVGSDLAVIRREACQRAHRLLEALLENRENGSDAVSRTADRADVVGANA